LQAFDFLTGYILGEAVRQVIVSKRRILASLTARQREMEAKTGEPKQRPKHGTMSHKLALLDARLTFLG
jgi:hypothetical protein